MSHCSQQEIANVLSREIRPEKGMQIGKEAKLSLLADDMALCLEKPRVHQNTIRTDKFGKVAGYKINIQNSVAFLHTNNEFAEKKNMKAISQQLQKAIKNIPRNDLNQGSKRPL
jgi:hypothetical protein